MVRGADGGSLMARSTSVAGLALAAALAAAPAVAAEPEALPAWERALYKTTPSQAAANLADAVVFSFLFDAGLQGGAGFLAANVASAVAVYYPYELAWNALGPAPEDMRGSDLAAKTVGYQVISGLRTFVVAYAFTQAMLPSAGFAAIAAAMGGGVFVVNELAWGLAAPR